MCWHGHDRYRWSEDVAPAGGGDLRISDADRQAVIDDLRHHTGDGRLTLEEFEERLDDVLRARTRAELDRVSDDLPPLRTEASRRRTGSRAGPAVRPWLLAAIVVVALLVAGHWWVLIPVGCFAFGGCGRRPSRREVAPELRDRDDSVTYA